MQNNTILPNNQMTQIPQTGQMQGTPFGLFQIQQGNDTIVMRQEGNSKNGYRMVPYKIVNGGNDGPILVNQQNPTIALDQKNRCGEVCPACGKGILLIDMDCLRNNQQCRQCSIFGPMCCCVGCPIVSWPCVASYCCYIRYCRKRTCTSCNESYPNTWCI